MMRVEAPTPGPTKKPARSRLPSRLSTAPLRFALALALAPALGSTAAIEAVAQEGERDTPGQSAARAPALPSLAAVPTPSLAGASDSVRARVEALLARVERERGNGPALAEAYGELGMLFLHYGFLDAAEPALGNAGRLVPDELRWRYYRAVALEQLGRLAEAADELRGALASREGNLPSVLRLAGILEQLGDSEEARFLYQAALQSPLGKPAGHAGLGRLALESGDARAALEHFETAFEAQPQATALRYQMGLAHRELGQLDRARELLTESDRQEARYPDPLMIQLALQFEDAGSRAAAAGQAALRGDLGRAAASYREALAQNPDDLQTRRSLALALLEAGERTAAAEEFRALLERDPDDATALLELGGLEIAETGDPTRGLPYFERAAAANPDLRDAHLRLARARITAGQLAAAVEPLGQAVRLDPRDDATRVLLARTLLDTGQVEPALEAVRALLAQRPDHFAARLLEGRIHAASDDPAAAEAIFEAQSASPTATAGERAEAYYLLGRFRQAQQQGTEAVRSYRKALEFDGEHRGALYDLAVLAASSQQLDEAVRLYQKLFDLDPDEDDYRYRLAVSLLRNGDHWPALGHFEALHQAHPRILEFTISSALLLAEVGQVDQAVERLETAIAETEPPGPRARLLSVLGGIELGLDAPAAGMARLDEAVTLAGDVPEVRQRYAQALANAKQYSAAADQYAAYVQLSPDDADAWFAYATALILADRWTDAKSALGEGASRLSHVPLTHLFARVLASAPDPDVRDGERAVQVAQAVFAAERNPAHGETLAMAMAAAGRYEEAVALQERLLTEAEAVRFDGGFVERVRANLERYRAGQPGVSGW